MAAAILSPLTRGVLQSRPTDIGVACLCKAHVPLHRSGLTLKACIESCADRSANRAVPFADDAPLVLTANPGALLRAWACLPRSAMEGL